MRPTSVITLTVLLLALTACGRTGVEPSTTPPTFSTLPDYDLTDLATQEALGSPSPDGVVWQRSVQGLTVFGLNESADPDEMLLLEAALAEVPERLLATVSPRFFVRSTDMAGAESAGNTVAATIGPDIHLFDRTFDESSQPTSRLDLTYALAHELAHVGQWFGLETEYVQRIAAGGLQQVRLVDGSSLVHGYATSVGWINSPIESDNGSWQLTDGSAPTTYGASSPAEDMADSVALAVIGRGNWLNEARLDWIAAWSNVSTEEFSTGKPWVPIGAVETISATPLFDENAAGDLAASTGASHVEPVSFIVSHPNIADLADEIESQLRQRGLAGTLGFVNDSLRPRHQGTFTRDDGVAYLIDLTVAIQPQDGMDAILTYVVIW